MGDRSVKFQLRWPGLQGANAILCQQNAHRLSPPGIRPTGLAVPMGGIMTRHHLRLVAESKKVSRAMAGMLIANVKNMQSFFSSYMTHDGDWGTRQLVELHRLFKGSSNAIHMRHVEEALKRANEVMHGHGVEPMSGQPDNKTITVALYVNMGDTYSSTIVYDCLSDKFYVGSWGDWFEWREKNKAYGLWGRN